MIPLVTSMPPSIFRRTNDGSEIGREYALECIRSWRNCGFYPVSVNAESELVSELIRTEDIKLITVRRDARNQFGKPLVYLGDFIAAACSLTDGPVVVANADILIDMPAATKHLVVNLKPGQCLVSRRYDIQDMDSREGKEYTFGYDFFAFHSRDLLGFSGDEFVIGMPWWDHYFPIHMYLLGLKSVPATKPFAFHLAHEEQWDFDNWLALGKRFLQLIQHETSGDCNRAALTNDYARRHVQAIAGHNGSPRSRVSAVMHRLAKATTAEKDIDILHRVAAVNMQWLDELGSRYT